MNEVKLNRGGLPETILPEENSDVLKGLHNAESLGNNDEKYSSLLLLAESHPNSIAVWVALGTLSSLRMQSYAFYRIAYHRGLDSLRKNGWRGSGFVRWAHPTNRDFLLALDGLQRLSVEIGDLEEATRCQHFLIQLEPNWQRVSNTLS